MAIIEAKDQDNLERFKEQATHNFALSQMVAVQFGDNSSKPMIWDFYPGLFEKEKEEFMAEEVRRITDERRNRTRKKKGGN